MMHAALLRPRSPAGDPVCLGCMSSIATSIEALPPDVTRVLQPLLERAVDALSSDLRSIVLYGSGAERQLRPTSDVNLIFVLRVFDRAAADALGEPLRVARAAANVRIMFLPENDIAAAASAFAIKFADIGRRRKVLYGDDPFATLTVRADALRRHVEQVLLNFELRTREAYVVNGVREEQLARVVARSAGPLRATAAGLLELRGERAGSPKAALEQIAAELPNGPWAPLLALISKARTERILPAGDAASAIDRLIDLARQLRRVASHD